MNLLIIEDDECCRRMLAEWARVLAKQAGLELITHETACLEEATVLIDQADGILCDGAFYTTRHDLFAYGRVRENWPFVAGHAAHRHIPFALLSGDVMVCTRARATGHMVFEKPAGARLAVEWLLGAMALRKEVGAVREPPVLGNQEPGENPVVAEMDEMNRRDAERPEEQENGKGKKQPA